MPPGPAWAVHAPMDGLLASVDRLAGERPKCPCKPSPVPAWSDLLASHGHSSRTSVARGLQRPYPRGSDGPSVSPRTGSPSYLVLLLVGFAKHRRSPNGLVSPYLTLSPLPASGGRSALCGTFLPVTGTPRYGAPCPVELGLSSRPDMGPATMQGTSALFHSLYINQCSTA